MTENNAVSRNYGALEYSAGSNALFSLTLFVALIPILGPGLYLIVFAVPYIAVANLVFLQWPKGSKLAVIRFCVLRSAFLTLLLFGLIVLAVWVMPGGQVGYGDQLQIDAEGHITALGFRALLMEAARVGIIAFVASVLICMPRSKGLAGP